MSTENLRNLAIVAHVDHGKTTLVDELLKQTEALTHHNHTTPIIYYKTSKWRTATATEDK